MRAGGALTEHFTHLRIELYIDYLNSDCKSVATTCKTVEITKKKNKFLK